MLKHVLSLQGGMAVGKTTAMVSLSRQYPTCHFAYENIAHLVAQRKSMGLDLRKQGGWVVNQRLFIQAECERYDSLPAGITVLDRGPEDVEFYTLAFPRTIGQEWDVEHLLRGELAELRTRRSHRILYLAATDDVLRHRRRCDTTRRRGSFEHYIAHLYPHEEKWFRGLGYVDVVDANCPSIHDLQGVVGDWLERQISHTGDALQG